jgi:hypothetical protein
MRSIIAKTGVTIYFPDPISLSTEKTAKTSPVLLSGTNPALVSQAKDLLLQLHKDKGETVSKRDVAVLPRKCDWLLLFKRNEVRNIMFENGTAVVFPAPGSADGFLSIYGEESFYLQQTCEAIMKICNDCHVATIQISPSKTRSGGNISFSSAVASPSLEKVSFSNNPLETVHDIAYMNGAEVGLRNGKLELYGLHVNVRETFDQLCQSGLCNQRSYECHYQIEQPFESKEFVSGKKDGKINKVMKASNSVVTFLDFNQWNIFIDISSNSHLNVLRGLEMVEQEIPAELSFHVPEVHHKRIIGHGGKNIQKIMKKYGVYVKFLNAEESRSKYGNYPFKPVSLMHNVIVRTPSKNSEGLFHLKQTVLELSEEKDTELTSLVFSVPFHLHSSIIFGNSKKISDMIALTQTEVSFPKAEHASDDITIIGFPSKLKVAKQIFQEMLPKEVYVIIKAGDISQHLTSPDFKQIVKALESDSITVVTPKVNGDGEYHLSLRLNKQSKNLANHQANIAKFFKSKDINVTMVSGQSETSTMKSPKVTPIRTFLSDSNLKGLNSATTETPQSAASPSNFQYFSSKLYNQEGTVSSPMQSLWGNQDIMFSPVDSQTPKVITYDLN